MAASVDQLLLKAQKHARGGEAKLAADLYRQVLQKFPANARAIEGLRALGQPAGKPVPPDSLEALVALYRADRHREIAERAEAWSARLPASAMAHTILGAVLAGLGRPDKAVAPFQRALALDPRAAESHYNLATALQASGQLDAALDLYRRALEIDPRYVDAQYNLAFGLKRLGRLDEAIAAYRRVLELRPRHAGAHNNLGNALKERGDFAGALASYAKALAVEPGFAEAHNNVGTLERERGNAAAAIVSYERALKARPDYAEAHANLGIALAGLGRGGEAAACFARALAINPRYAVAHQELGNVLNAQGRLDEALASYARAAEIDPDYGEARASLLHQQGQLCLWDSAEATAETIRRLDASGAIAPPLSMLALEDNPARHRQRSERFAAAQYHGAPLPPMPAEPRGDERIAVGYFSADFHDHATMHLMARVFELHDQSRFRIHAYSYGLIDDAVTARLRRAVARYDDIRGLSDSAAAELARRHGIDIAVDLKGYTKQSRTGIFAYRPAPVQVNYLGYPGTLGAPFIDYIVADPTLIPDASRPYYSEQVIRLPGCYQANDNTRPIATATPSRAECGLPETGIVFCCFDASFKIRPPEFDIWMRLLKAVEGSVLWLLRSNRWVEANLRREAEQRGMDPARLVFADRLPLAEHLARHRLADLFVDTFNYTAHTTAADALWAGLPLVAHLGESFSARVAASLLRAIGLPELVATTVAGYEALALGLATDPARLTAIRAKLRANRDSSPVFDSARFTRGLEEAYRRIDERHRRGLPPAHLDVPAE